MAEETKILSYGWGFRHYIALMHSLSMMIAYAMRVTVSIAIVSMTDPRQTNSFDWSTQVQSMILSSFFWGYIVLQIPAGVLASRFGGKVLICICIGVNSATALLLPIGSYYGGWQIVCACRVVQGLSQGLLFPSMHNLVGKWVPVEEKSSIGTFIYAGGQIGNAIQLILAGYISEYWGWPAIFYSTGTFGAIWTVLYIFTGADSPQTSRLISEKERLYIQRSLGHVAVPKKLKTPWKSIWTSMAFISLIVTHCGQNFGYWTLVTEIPLYMSKVLGVDIKSNGVMSALPYLAMFIMSFPFGYISDLALAKNWISLTASRKLCNSIGLYGAGLALIALSYSPAGNVTVAVILLTVIMALNAGHFCGWLLVHIDMSPNFAGQMMGITNFFANIMSLIAPLIAGVLLVDDTDPGDWRKVFYLSSAIFIISNTVFIIFGTSERQKWDEVPDNDDTIICEKTAKASTDNV